MAEWLSVQGTATGAGKTVVTAAICEKLAAEGHNVAPFKPVNYSLNAFPVDGTEIGYSTKFQADKCGVEVAEEMNPVLVKMMEDRAEIITDTVKTVASSDIDSAVERQKKYIERCAEALDRRYEYVVFEGFGSLVNSNLDYNANTALMEKMEPRTVLVGSASRGGVESSLAGTLGLLPGKIESLVEVLVINRMHEKAPGQEKLRDFLEEETGKKTVLLPEIEQLNTPPEDSMPRFDGSGEIAVIGYPNASNTSDLWRLPEQKTAVVEKPEELENAALVVLPGSKDIFSDLEWMRERGIDTRIKSKSGESMILGICGGYQMLGEKVSGNDVEEGETDGLGLVDIETSYRDTKTREQVRVSFRGREFDGYRIHYGETDSPENGLFRVKGRDEGYYDGKTIGTYVHDALADEFFLSWLLEEAGIEDADVQGSGFEEFCDSAEKIVRELV